MSTIAERYVSTTQQLPDAVDLVVVSKFHSEEEILEVYRAGGRNFGENHVQELVPKFQHLPQDIRWHFIGNLQRNKVKQIVPFVYLIHSVDSESLFLEISKRAKAIQREVNILIEVHIAEESSKEGYPLKDVVPFLKKLSLMDPHETFVKVCGLMGMATFTDDAEQVKREFSVLHNLFLESKKNFFNNHPYFKILSMGMSGDWPLAIECGSNMLRIGSLIMGQRTASGK